MNRKNIFPVVIILFSSIFFIGFNVVKKPQDLGSDDEFKKEWSKVEEFISQGRPRSAIEIVENIFNEAHQRKLIPQELKAAAYKCQLWQMYEEDPIIKSIDYIKSLKSEPKGVAKSIYELMLAGLYSDYLERNSWKLLKQQAGKELSEDLRLWSPAQFASETQKLIINALKNQEAMQKIPVAKYQAILSSEDSSALFRPTLYDIAAFYGIEKLSGLARFEIPGPSGIADPQSLMVPVDAFLKLDFDIWKNATQARLQIYQNILAFHQKEGNVNALVDADLHRLDFAWSVFDDVKTDDFIHVLEALAYQWKNNPIASEIQFKLAKTLYEIRWEKRDKTVNENKIRAMEICNSVLKKYPQSRAAKNCKILKENILTPYLTLETENTCLPQEEMPLRIYCRNTDTIWLNVYTADINDLIESRGYYLNKKTTQKYMKNTALHSWSVQMHGVQDYDEHELNTFLPPLKKGYYVIVASRKQFPEKHKNDISAWIDFQVTELSLVTDKAKEDLRFFVQNRKDGKPLANVEIELLLTWGDKNSHPQKLLTNTKGEASISNDESENYQVILKSTEDIYVPQKSLYTSKRYKQLAKPKTWFFTDRAIYRPGQRVFYKGITTQQIEKGFELVKNEETHIYFYDVNHKVIAEKELSTNEFGAFDGSFNIPEGLLNGSMQIRNEYGSIYFDVEEYKRPTFEVKLEQPKGSLKPGAEIKLYGKAITYNQLPLSNAVVRYRVERSDYLPYSWFFYQPNQAENITSGEIITDAKGGFELSFIARPSEYSSGSWRNYQFSVFADVISISGETHSDELSVFIGDQPFFLTVEGTTTIVDNNIQPYKFKSINLNGEDVKTKATLQLFSLKSNEDLPRTSFFGEAYNERPVEGGYRSDIEYISENSPVFQRGKLAYEQQIEISDSGFVLSTAGLENQKPGNYRILISSNAEGKIISDSLDVLLVNSKSNMMAFTSWSWFYVDKANSLQVGDFFDFYLGSSAEDVSVHIEISQNGDILKQEDLILNNGVKKLTYKIEESWRGNVGLSAWFIKENRLYRFSEMINVPWKNKELEIKTITFRDKMSPGAKELWSFRISGPNGEKAAASVLSGMYDRSLDVFAESNWNFVHYPTFGHRQYFWDAFGTSSSTSLYSYPYRYKNYLIQYYDQFNILSFSAGRGRMHYSRGGEQPVMLMKEKLSVAGDDMDKNAEFLNNEEVEEEEVLFCMVEDQVEPERQKKKTIPQPRTNLNETAFFYPDLRTNVEGDVIVEFTAPEALTAWKFRMLAYTEDLKTAQITKEAITTKELMVFPNMPRFVREGDVLELPAIIHNKTDKNCDAEAFIQIHNPLNGKDITDEILQGKNRIVLNINAQSAGNASWTLKVPNAEMPLQIAVFAETEKHQDGEQRILPVLSSRIPITESRPIYINPGTEKQLNMEEWVQKLERQGVEEYRLSIEFTGNPAWYAIQALPALAEPVYENALTLSNAFYATSVSDKIASSSERIRMVIESWKQLQPEALLSNLQKNEELKEILLQETPWVLEAENENAQKQRLALLFDLNTLSYRLNSHFNKLADLQNADGGFGWFSGMRSGLWTTMSVLDKMLRLEEMSIKLPAKSKSLIRSAMRFINGEMLEDYNKLMESKNFVEDKYYPSSLVVAWLEMTENFKQLGHKMQNSDTNYQEMHEFFSKRVLESWTSYNLYVQTKIASYAFAIGNDKVANAIVASLREKALHSDEMGMYWRRDNGWYWSSDPIGRQTAIIVLFAKHSLYPDEVEQMKMWLLKQKQTGIWPSNSNTADACYALLLKGTDLLENEDNLKISLNENGRFIPLEVTKEAGTGYFKKQWNNQKTDNIAIHSVKMVNKGTVPSWGAVYMSFLADASKVEEHQGPLSIQRMYFMQATDGSLTKLKEGDEIHPGDRIMVRLIVESDRKLEFVHIRDYHAAGMEVENSNSGYFWGASTGYYLDMKDATANFFIDYMPKGLYQYEYSLIAAQKGQFSNGLASARCLYAPEFAAHSEGSRLIIK